ncbi:uncharacterized protein N7515_000094 [Penicillium bovifimosum]|uniref:Uncharacterized protein n=1 Tax=Penicillium bovifimosum TaxID=126998 RepID=A0A9W9HGL5_9EURO|nr:uncharacterized protein N7515_000094 [Penicillium bovifimosum]KAJ5145530.1 hypothetical protein N7515_000094 [Penicillium bovifimosum]
MRGKLYWEKGAGKLGISNSTQDLLHEATFSNNRQQRPAAAGSVDEEPVKTPQFVNPINNLDFTAATNSNSSSPLSSSARSSSSANTVASNSMEQAAENFKTSTTHISPALQQMNLGQQISPALQQMNRGKFCVVI